LEQRGYGLSNRGFRHCNTGSYTGCRMGVGALPVNEADLAEDTVKLALFGVAGLDVVDELLVPAVVLGAVWTREAARIR
jgi:hypothetical protein